jgi:hypothetical protein
MRTEGRTDLTKLIIAFQNFAYASKDAVVNFNSMKIMVFFPFLISRDLTAHLSHVLAFTYSTSVMLLVPHDNSGYTVVLRQYVVSDEYQLHIFEFPVGILLPTYEVMIYLAY